MRNRTQSMLLALVVLVASLTPLLATEFYKLDNVKRLEKDLYRSGKLLIMTRFCFHFTFGETAILKYEGSGEYSGSKIIWDDDSTCDVRKVVSE